MSTISKEMVRVKITFSEIFIIEPHLLQGRSVDQLIQEWFADRIINQSHASRDYYRLGGSKRLVDYEILKKE